MKLRITITGGAGYIGSTLTDQIKDDHDVVVVDSFCIDTKHKRNNSQLLKQRGIRVIESNISESDRYHKAIKDTDLLIYMASLNSRSESEANPLHYIEENAKALQIFLKTLSLSSPRLKKVILTSSRSVYGEGKYKCDQCKKVGELSENRSCLCGGQLKPLSNIETDITMPRSIYGLTKRYQEEQFQLYCLQHNISLDIFRIYNVFGHDQEKFYNHIGILPMLYEQIVHKREVTLLGNGKIYRDYVDVNNVVEVLLQAINQYEIPRFEIFNLGSGQSYSLLDICQIFRHALSVDFTIRKDPNNDDIRHSQAETTKLLSNFKISLNSVSSFIEKYYKTRTTRQYNQSKYE